MVCSEQVGSVGPPHIYGCFYGFKNVFSRKRRNLKQNKDESQRNTDDFEDLKQKLEGIVQIRLDSNGPGSKEPSVADFSSNIAREQNKIKPEVCHGYYALGCFKRKRKIESSRPRESDPRYIHSAWTSQENLMSVRNIFNGFNIEHDSAENRKDILMDAVENVKGDASTPSPRETGRTLRSLFSERSDVDKMEVGDYSRECAEGFLYNKNPGVAPSLGDSPFPLLATLSYESTHSIKEETKSLKSLSPTKKTPYVTLKPEKTEESEPLSKKSQVAEPLGVKEQPKPRKFFFRKNNDTNAKLNQEKETIGSNSPNNGTNERSLGDQVKKPRRFFSKKNANDASIVEEGTKKPRRSLWRRKQEPTGPIEDQPRGLKRLFARRNQKETPKQEDTSVNLETEPSIDDPVDCIRYLYKVEDDEDKLSGAKTRRTSWWSRRKGAVPSESDENKAPKARKLFTRKSKEADVPGTEKTNKFKDLFSKKNKAKEQEVPPPGGKLMSNRSFVSFKFVYGKPKDEDSSKPFPIVGIKYIYDGEKDENTVRPKSLFKRNKSTYLSSSKIAEILPNEKFSLRKSFKEATKKGENPTYSALNDMKVYCDRLIKFLGVKKEDLQEFSYYFPEKKGMCKRKCLTDSKYNNQGFVRYLTKTDGIYEILSGLFKSKIQKIDETINLLTNKSRRIEKIMRVSTSIDNFDRVLKPAPLRSTVIGTVFNLLSKRDFMDDIINIISKSDIHMDKIAQSLSTRDNHDKAIEILKKKDDIKFKFELDSSPEDKAEEPFELADSENEGDKPSDESTDSLNQDSKPLSANNNEEESLFDPTVELDQSQVVGDGVISGTKPLSANSNEEVPNTDLYQEPVDSSESSTDSLNQDSKPLSVHSNEEESLFDPTVEEDSDSSEDEDQECSESSDDSEDNEEDEPKFPGNNDKDDDEDNDISELVGNEDQQYYSNQKDNEEDHPSHQEETNEGLNLDHTSDENSDSEHKLVLDSEEYELYEQSTCCGISPSVSFSSEDEALKSVDIDLSSLIITNNFVEEVNEPTDNTDGRGIEVDKQKNCLEEEENKVGENEEEQEQEEENEVDKEEDVKEIKCSVEETEAIILDKGEDETEDGKCDESISTDLSVCESRNEQEDKIRTKTIKKTVIKRIMKKSKTKKTAPKKTPNPSVYTVTRRSQRLQDLHEELKKMTNQLTQLLATPNPSIMVTRRNRLMISTMNQLKALMSQLTLLIKTPNPSVQTVTRRSQLLVSKMTQLKALMSQLTLLIKTPNPSVQTITRRSQALVSMQQEIQTIMSLMLYDDNCDSKATEMMREYPEDKSFFSKLIAAYEKVIESLSSGIVKGIEKEVEPEQSDTVNKDLSVYESRDEALDKDANEEIVKEDKQKKCLKEELKELEESEDERTPRNWDDEESESSEDNEEEQEQQQEEVVASDSKPLSVHSNEEESQFDPTVELDDQYQVVGDGVISGTKPLSVHSNEEESSTGLKETQEEGTFEYLDPPPGSVNPYYTMVKKNIPLPPLNFLETDSDPDFIPSRSRSECSDVPDSDPEFDVELSEVEDPETPFKQKVVKRVRFDLSQNTYHYYKYEDEEHETPKATEDTDKKHEEEKLNEKYQEKTYLQEEESEIEVVEDDQKDEENGVISGTKPLSVHSNEEVPNTDLYQEPVEDSAESTGSLDQDSKPLSANSNEEESLFDPTVELEVENEPSEVEETENKSVGGEHRVDGEGIETLIALARIYKTIPYLEPLDEYTECAQNYINMEKMFNGVGKIWLKYDDEFLLLKKSVNDLNETRHKVFRNEECAENQFKQIHRKLKLVTKNLAKVVMRLFTIEFYLTIQGRRLELCSNWASGISIEVEENKFTLVNYLPSLQNLFQRIYMENRFIAEHLYGFKPLLNESGKPYDPTQLPEYLDLSDISKVFAEGSCIPYRFSKIGFNLLIQTLKFIADIPFKFYENPFDRQGSTISKVNKILRETAKGDKREFSKIPKLRKAAELLRNFEKITDKSGKLAWHIKYFMSPEGLFTEYMELIFKMQDVELMRNLVRDNVKEEEFNKKYIGNKVTSFDKRTFELLDDTGKLIKKMIKVVEGYM